MFNKRDIIRSKLSIGECILYPPLLFLGITIFRIFLGIILSHSEISTKIKYSIPFAILLYGISIAINEFKYIIINTRVNRIRVFSLRYIWGKRYDINFFKKKIISWENGGFGDYKIAYLVDKSMHTRLKINGSIYNNCDEIINSINLPKIGYPEISISKYIQLVFTGRIKVEDKSNKNGDKKKVVISRLRSRVLMLYPVVLCVGIVFNYMFVKKIILNPNEIEYKILLYIPFVLMVVLVLVSTNEFKFIVINPHINQIRIFSLFVWGKRYDIKDYKGIILSHESNRTGYYKVAYLVDNTMHTRIKLNANNSNIDEMVEVIDLPKIEYLAFVVEHFTRLIFTGRIKIDDEQIIKSFKTWKSKKTRRKKMVKKRGK